MKLLKFPHLMGKCGDRHHHSILNFMIILQFKENNMLNKDFSYREKMLIDFFNHKELKD